MVLSEVGKLRGKADVGVYWEKERWSEHFFLDCKYLSMFHWWARASGG